MVPRRLLDEANNAVQRLKKKLDETTQTGRREMDTALRSMQMSVHPSHGTQGPWVEANHLHSDSTVRDRRGYIYVHSTAFRMTICPLEAPWAPQ